MTRFHCDWKLQGSWSYLFFPSTQWAFRRRNTHESNNKSAQDLVHAFYCCMWLSLDRANVLHLVLAHAVTPMLHNLQSVSLAYNVQNFLSFVPYRLFNIDFSGFSKLRPGLYLLRHKTMSSNFICYSLASQFLTKSCWNFEHLEPEHALWIIWNCIATARVCHFCLSELLQPCFDISTVFKCFISVGYRICSVEWLNPTSAAGLVYVNCAVVPRHRMIQGMLATHFVEVIIENGTVISARNVWVTDASSPRIVSVEELIRSDRTEEGQFSRTFFKAYESVWSTPVAMRQVSK